MWSLVGLILLVILFVYIRRSKLLRTYFYSKLYRIGIQYGKHIYTPVCDIYTDFYGLDFVFLRLKHKCLWGYRFLHGECFRIPLTYVDVGHHLKYVHDGEEVDHMYMEGTPFSVEKGHLILYQRKRKGLSYISEEIKRSQQWPM